MLSNNFAKNKTFRDLENYSLTNRYRKREQQLYNILDSVKQKSTSDYIHTHKSFKVLNEVKRTSELKTSLRQIYNELSSLPEYINKHAEISRTNIESIKTQTREPEHRNKLITREIDKFRANTKNKITHIKKLVNIAKKKLDQIETKRTRIKNQIKQKLDDIEHDLDQKIETIDNNTEKVITSPQVITNNIHEHIKKAKQAYDNTNSITKNFSEKLCEAINNVIDQINQTINDLSHLGIDIQIGEGDLLQAIQNIHLDLPNINPKEDFQNLFDKYSNKLTQDIQNITNLLKDPCKVFKSDTCSMQGDIIDELFDSIADAIDTISDISDDVYALLHQYLNEIKELIHQIFDLLNSLMNNLGFHLHLGLNLHLNQLQKIDLGPLVCALGLLNSAEKLLRLGIPNINNNLDVLNNYSALLNDTLGNFKTSTLPTNINVKVL